CILHLCEDDENILPPDLPEYARLSGQCILRTERRCCGEIGIPPMSQMPPRDCAGKSSMARNGYDSRACNAHDRGRIPRSTLCGGFGGEAWCRHATSLAIVPRTYRSFAKRGRWNEARASRQETDLRY